MTKGEKYKKEFEELDKALKKRDPKFLEVLVKVKERGPVYYGVTKSKMLYKWHTYVALEVWNNKLIERTFAFKFHGNKVNKNNDNKLYFYEIMRKIVGNNYTAVSYYLTSTIGGIRMDIGSWSGNEIDPDNLPLFVFEQKFIYQNTWKRSYTHLVKTPDDIEPIKPYIERFGWQYSQYEKYLKDSIYFFNRLPRIKYFSLYQEYPQIELLVKAGFSHLVSEVRYMNPKGKTLEQIFKLGKEDIEKLKSPTSGYILRELQIRHNAFLKYKFCNEEEFKTYVNFKRRLNEDTQSDLKELKKIVTNDLGYVAKYLNKNQINHRDYMDYLINAYKLNINLIERKHLCPPVDDFTRLHDEYALRVLTVENEALDNQIKQTAITLKKKIKSKLKLPGQAYCVVTPVKAGEIKYEGSKLNHCVGTYVDRVARGDTAIVFIRKIDNINQPLVTAEIDLKRKCLVQARAASNASPPKDVINFIKTWCNETKIRNEVFA